MCIFNSYYITCYIPILLDSRHFCANMRVNQCVREAFAIQLHLLHTGSYKSLSIWYTWFSYWISYEIKSTINRFLSAIGSVVNIAVYEWISCVWFYYNNNRCYIEAFCFGFLTLRLQNGCLKSELLATATKCSNLQQMFVNYQFITMFRR